MTKLCNMTPTQKINQESILHITKIWHVNSIYEIFAPDWKPTYISSKCLCMVSTDSPEVILACTHSFNLDEHYIKLVHKLNTLVLKPDY